MSSTSLLSWSDGPAFDSREFPQIESFTKQAHLFDRVQVSYRWGFTPRLVLTDSEKQRETVRIDSWTTDDVLEFLTKRGIKSKAID